MRKRSLGSLIVKELCIFILTRGHAFAHEEKKRSSSESYNAKSIFVVRGEAD